MLLQPIALRGATVTQKNIRIGLSRRSLIAAVFTIPRNMNKLPLKRVTFSFTDKG